MSLPALRRCATAAVMVVLALGLRAQGEGNRFLLSPRPALPPGPLDTNAICVADFDGDGDQDLAFGDIGLLRILMNQGDGVFLDETQSRVLTQDVLDIPREILAVDLDGDRALDLVVACASTYFPGSQVLWNDGQGRFRGATAQEFVRTTDMDSGCAVGDLDADGRLDLVFCQFPRVGTSGRNRIYLNQGGRRFVDVGLAGFNSRWGAWDVDAGDVDGDGDLDLAFTTWLQDYLYLNDGLGGFVEATAARLPPNRGFSISLCLVDVDRDRDLDLVRGNGTISELAVLENDGRGYFRDATATRVVGGWTYGANQVLAADLNEDGWVDFVLNTLSIDENRHDFRLYLNDGTGRLLEASNRYPWKRTVRDYSLGVGDVDGDGDLDVVTGSDMWGGKEDRLFLNLLRQAVAPKPPAMGDTYEVTFHSMVLELAVPILGTRQASLALPPFGTLGVDPNGMVVLPILATGKQALRLPIPADPSLRGGPLFVQGLVVDPRQPQRARFTNLLRERIR